MGFWKSLARAILGDDSEPPSRPIQSAPPESRKWTRADYYHPTYRRSRAAAFARSGGVCQACGQADAAQAHHWAMRYAPPELTSPDDLTALCLRCHKIITAIRRGVPLIARPRRRV